MIESIINKITNDKFNNIFEKLEKHDKEITGTNLKVQKIIQVTDSIMETTDKIEAKMGNIDIKMDSIGNKIKNYEINLKKIESSMDMNHRELIKLIATMK